ncbi:hypothetical protein ANN_26861 [Periplaneta americana]|uniref:Uncharacterized protein n=1 Tax=Periplaneta americana TaxID=6978 RepID=A0ABQ8RZ92_PERAM|nr:hypothetical protein ANN_26861 [Periplaneta americana]
MVGRQLVHHGPPALTLHALWTPIQTTWREISQEPIQALFDSTTLRGSDCSAHTIMKSHGTDKEQRRYRSQWLAHLLTMDSIRIPIQIDNYCINQEVKGVKVDPVQVGETSVVFLKTELDGKAMFSLCKNNPKVCPSSDSAYINSVMKLVPIDVACLSISEQAFRMRIRNSSRSAVTTTSKVSTRAVPTISSLCSGAMDLNARKNDIRSTGERKKNGEKKRIEESESENRGESENNKSGIRNNNQLYASKRERLVRRYSETDNLEKSSTEFLRDITDCGSGGSGGVGGGGGYGGDARIRTRNWVRCHASSRMIVLASETVCPVTRLMLLNKVENKVLRKIFGAKRDEVTGEWRKLHIAELHAFYSSPDIIRNIKSLRSRWAGHVARMGESRNAYRVLVGRPVRRRPLGRPRRRWEDNLNMDLREVGYDGRDWINLAPNRDRRRVYVRATMIFRVS